MIGRRRGSTVIEAAMFVPVFFLLLVGMVELARVAYTYYTLQKILYTLARYVGTQQGINFCDGGDATIVAAKNYAVRGTVDETGEPYLPGLTTEMLQIRVERFDTDNEELAECECSITGCDTAAGGGTPDFLVVSIPDGYPIRLNIPSLPLDAIPLRPLVRIPFGGT